MKFSTLFICVLVTLSIVCAGCSNSRPIKNCETFTEMADPTADTLSDWSAVPAGLNASLVSIDKKYAKSVAPEVNSTSSCNLTGWKGEILSSQLLLWSADSIKQVEFEFSGFSSADPKSASIDAQARFVRYVMTDVFEPGCGYRKPEDFPASLTPDMLDNIECMNMDAKTVRPVWLTFSIPQSIAAGEYKGMLKVFARNQKTQEFEINIKVQDKTLPEPSQWAYHLDLWQHPAAVARTQKLQLWSDEHFAAMKPLMKMLADAGQKVITTNVNKDPWHNQCFDGYADMITWTKNTDGTWTYDYNIFDRWVSMMMDLGINKMINCYSLVPWNNELHYNDAATNKLVDVKADPGTKVAEEIWTPFLQDFVKHLKEKGWLEITNIAMDERSPKEMNAALDLLKKAAPELGISLADNHKSYKRYPYIKDMSVKCDAKVDSVDLAYRREHGLVTTYYVCCSDKFPNMFTFTDSPEPVYAAWYALAANYDGMLRWAYNSWVENPLTDSRFRTWPAGDTYIVYPEARSSIRFERLREGIQDVEKVRILRNELTGEKLKMLNDEVAKFNTVTPEKYVQMLNDAKKLVNELSE